MAFIKNTSRMWTIFYVCLIVAGCVLACSTLIPNDYLKLVVVMGSLMIGLYGIMKTLSRSRQSRAGNSSSAEE